MTYHVTHRHVVTWFRDTKKLMVPLNYWYKPLAGTTETFVLGNGWYKCVIGTKK
jgi:hypothetical protein